MDPSQDARLVVTQSFGCCLVALSQPISVAASQAILVQFIELTCVLNHGKSRQSVVRVVIVRLGGRLVFHSSLVLLAADKGVALQSKRVEQPLSFEVSFSFQRYVEKFENSSLPPIIARIHQLIGSPIKSTFEGKLPFCQPFNHPVQVKFIRFS